MYVSNNTYVIGPLQGIQRDLGSHGKDLNEVHENAQKLFEKNPECQPIKEELGKLDNQYQALLNRMKVCL